MTEDLGDDTGRQVGGVIEKARALAFTPDGRTMVAGIRVDTRQSRDVVRNWDVATGKPGRAWTDDLTIG